MTIDFYRQMNEERDDQRWHAWASHRMEINELVRKTITEEMQPAQIIVLGAGNCDDLDLRFLQTTCKTITLVDNDGDALEKAIARYADIDLAGQIRLIKHIDFTTLDWMDFYRRFVSMLACRTDANEVLVFLQQCSLKIRDHELLASIKNQFSVVISSAVYTQIFYIHALSLLAPYAEQYSKRDVRLIIEGLIHLRNQVILKYNDLLLSLVSKNGKIIVWTDFVKLDSTMDFVKETIYDLRTDADRSSYLFKIMWKYGKDAAFLGLQDLLKKLGDEETWYSCWIWPYDKKNQYLTFGISGMRNQVDDLRSDQI